MPKMILFQLWIEVWEIQKQESEIHVTEDIYSVWKYFDWLLGSIHLDTKMKPWPQYRAILELDENI